MLLTNCPVWSKKNKDSLKIKQLKLSIKNTAADDDLH